MSSLDKMWLSFYAMGAMFVCMILISISRNKLNNKLLKFVFSLTAWLLLLFAFFSMVYIVFSGPTGG
ncbi:hypothetical protein C772_00432 [Bhargavaea cecembensis DSE10]|uniref:NAD(FAD)-dependent dehydrogenase n=1 Tax=Bhargavaea cecembensis DSE10 TaxID=1235279 RepID=M7NJU7_9BACL|nr:DUF2768 domain-containing protein [Bhargavaea cecembensis]EMR07416.1 hypothetical protein C772_00432 [Bhargavaea cecembensis DSE10]